ncbi:MAG: hypothetical protein ACJATT_003174 [Myxococcota bacterium]|jgi:hypothetical protein
MKTLSLEASNRIGLVGDMAGLLSAMTSRFRATESRTTMLPDTLSE